MFHASFSSVVCSATAGAAVACAWCVCRAVSPPDRRLSYVLLWFSPQ